MPMPWAYESFSYRFFFCFTLVFSFAFLHSYVCLLFFIITIIFIIIIFFLILVFSIYLRGTKKKQKKSSHTKLNECDQLCVFENSIRCFNRLNNKFLYLYICIFFIFMMLKWVCVISYLITFFKKTIDKRKFFINLETSHRNNLVKIPTDRSLILTANWF